MTTGKKMKIPLTEHEVRVPGCLLEKQMATFDIKKDVFYALNLLKQSSRIRLSNISRLSKYEHICRHPKFLELHLDF